MRSYFLAPHSRSASASKSAFNVSSTVARTTSSKCAWMRPSSICTTGPNTGAVPFPVPTPASSVGSIVLVPEVSLPLFVPAFQAYKPNQLCERNPTLSIPFEQSFCIKGSEQSPSRRFGLQNPQPSFRCVKGWETRGLVPYFAYKV